MDNGTIQYPISFNELMKHQIIICSKTFSYRFTCYITQDYTVGSFFLDGKVTSGRRSKHLALVIRDIELDRFVALKLSTFRKIATWINWLGFDGFSRNGKLGLKERILIALKEKISKGVFK